METTLLSGVPVDLSISAYFFLAKIRFFSGMIDFLLLFSEKNRRKAADRLYPPTFRLDFISYFRVYCVFHLFSLLFYRIKCCFIHFSLISLSFLQDKIPLCPFCTYSRFFFVSYRNTSCIFTLSLMKYRL